MGMATIAILLKQMGIRVSGVDTTEVFPTDAELKKEQVEVFNFDKDTLPEGVEMVVYSAAHGGSENPLVRHAKSNGIHTMHQAAFLGLLMGEFSTPISIAGCHGKTTTTALAAYTLIKMGEKPSYIVGAPSFGEQSEYAGGSFRGNNLLIVESDEYAIDPHHDKTSKLRFLKPSVALVTNIDFDHPDVFDSLDHTKETFYDFFQSVAERQGSQSKHPFLIVCADNKPLMEVVKRCPQEWFITYGYSNDADFYIQHAARTESGTSFSIKNDGHPVERYQTGLYGDKNISNAAGVIALLTILGHDVESIKKGMAGFAGARRRFEKIGEVNTVPIIDDYAHHPEELRALLASARSRYPDKRIVLVFQPHTFSRTIQFKEAFIEALATADRAIIAPIFASARESEEANSISSLDMGAYAAMKLLKNISGTDSKKKVVALLKAEFTQNDVIILAGAGDVYTLKDDIISAIEK